MKFNIINKIFGKNKKVEPPDTMAIIKLNDFAKENGVYDDENKIIELKRHGKIQKIKYSESDVDALREQGIPVIDEEYSDEYEFFDLESGGNLEYKK